MSFGLRFEGAAAPLPLVKNSEIKFSGHLGTFKHIVLVLDTAIRWEGSIGQSPMPALLSEFVYLKFFSLAPCSATVGPINVAARLSAQGLRGRRAPLPREGYHAMPLSFA